MIKMWLGTEYWTEPHQRVLPWSGGWLDWDLHECKGLQWLKELVKEIQGDNERRSAAREAAQGFFGNV